MGYPLGYPAPLLFPKPKLLIVIDRATGPDSNSPSDSPFGISYGTPDATDLSYFTFSHLLSVLESYASLTKAHRQTDPSSDNGAPTPADLENFSFTDVNLASYDQIWLIGYNSQVPAAGDSRHDFLSDAELAAISQFMNAGGGVFAVGDHGGLGLSMAGRVPRVRSMRKWWYPNLGPLGEPIAPPPFGAERLDTTQRNPTDSSVTDSAGNFLTSDDVAFDDQSDDIPQYLMPPWDYSQNLCFEPSPGVQLPIHPVLRGSSGFIQAFADHMHEGEVITPSDYSRRFSFNGGPEFAEYPLGSNGQIVEPQIIAYSETNYAASIVTSNEPHQGSVDASAPRSFGAIGAYDGFLSNVGRIIVESTFHHFMDINLIGDPVAPSPKDQGFLASPSGRQVLAGINRYYANVLHWLLPRSWSSKLWFAATIHAIRRQPLAEVLSSVSDHAPVSEIGNIAVGSLKNVVSAEMMIAWLQAALSEKIRNSLPALPWGPVTGTTGCGAIDHRQILFAALGGAVLAAKKLPKTRSGDQLTEAEQESIMRGTLRGASTLARPFERRGEGLLRAARALREERPG